MMQDHHVNENVALRLGRFVSDVQWRDLSEPLLHDAKRSLVNFFGAAIGVARDPDIDALAAAQARGSVEKPLSDAELEAKVYDLASERLPQADIAQCIDRLWQLHTLATIHPLMALVSVPA